MLRRLIKPLTTLPNKNYVHSSASRYSIVDMFHDSLKNPITEQQRKWAADYYKARDNYIQDLNRNLVYYPGPRDRHTNYPTTSTVTPIITPTDNPIPSVNTNSKK